ncbi:uncharacterized protein LOC113216180 isoform X1 [Frankliniella occidentalis]|uniref:Uncharacterized protein LOC113216180 isoform X1 n=1 Tax=Frankliniella occidentalis TaxID=133901 RepID=A0A9C6WQ14_FRAOC|nr:uncharacterized protein LOC113216180 isoform X1 [Frankliniella occidentalis]XP_052124112.1 uncharacterized protein LOC113216180 isoform X1 [Frankliniella occidentalis]
MSPAPTRCQPPRACKSKKSRMSASEASRTPPTGTAMNHQEKTDFRLDVLPDLSLLEILWYLPLKDLVAAGRASPRLCALTRTKMRLWQTEDTLALKNYNDICDALAVAPPVDILAVAPAAPALDPLAGKLTVVPDDAANTTGLSRKLVLFTRGCVLAESVDSLIREVAQTVKRLEVDAELAWIFTSLQEANWSKLEHLQISAQELVPGGVTGAVGNLLWPQDVVLPRLQTVVVEPLYFEYSDTHRLFDISVEHFAALESLLRAHREQLDCVKLCLSQLLPLVEACSSDLHRLEVEIADNDDVAVLRRMRGLKQLKIGVDHLYPDFKLTDLLRCWVGPLEHLVLQDMIHETVVHALGAGALKRLLFLVIWSDWDDDTIRGTPGPLRHLPEALAGLPRLRSLALQVPLHVVLPDITPASIAALELLIVACECAKSRCRCAGETPSSLSLCRPRPRGLTSVAN